MQPDTKLAWFNKHGPNLPSFYYNNQFKDTIAIKLFVRIGDRHNIIYDITLFFSTQLMINCS